MPNFTEPLTSPEISNGESKGAQPPAPDLDETPITHQKMADQECNFDVDWEIICMDLERQNNRLRARVAQLESEAKSVREKALKEAAEVCRTHTNNSCNAGFASQWDCEQAILNLSKTNNG